MKFLEWDLREFICGYMWHVTWCNGVSYRQTNGLIQSNGVDLPAPKAKLMTLKEKDMLVTQTSKARTKKTKTAKAFSALHSDKECVPACPRESDLHVTWYTGVLLQQEVECGWDHCMESVTKDREDTFYSMIRVQAVNS